MSYLCAESTEEGKPDMTESKCKIFIKKISKEFTHSVV